MEAQNSREATFPYLIASSTPPFMIIIDERVNPPADAISKICNGPFKMNATHHFRHRPRSQIKKQLISPKGYY